MSAPKGNQYAKGNKGNKHGGENSKKRGIYSRYGLQGAEITLFKRMTSIPPENFDEEAALVEEIRLIQIEKRRLLKQQEDLQKHSEEQILMRTSKTEILRTFKDDDERAAFEAVKAERIAAGKKMPGDSYTLRSDTERGSSLLVYVSQRLDDASKRLIRALDTLARIRLTKARLQIMETGPQQQQEEAVMDIYLEALQEAEKEADHGSSGCDGGGA